MKRGMSHVLNEEFYDQMDWTETGLNRIADALFTVGAGIKDVSNSIDNSSNYMHPADFGSEIGEHIGHPLREIAEKLGNLAEMYDLHNR